MGFILSGGLAGITERAAAEWMGLDGTPGSLATIGIEHHGESRLDMPCARMIADSPTHGVRSHRRSWARKIRYPMGKQKINSTYIDALKAPWRINKVLDAPLARHHKHRCAGRLFRALNLRHCLYHFGEDAAKDKVSKKLLYGGFSTCDVTRTERGM
jgi:hypothetical protein